MRDIITYYGENIYRNLDAGSHLRWKSGPFAADTLEGIKSLIRQAHLPRYKTAKGRLTPYALACGYIERRALEGFTDADVTLWHEGGPVFQVRAHDRETGTRLFWESTDTLGEARKIYDRAERLVANT